MSVRTLLNWEKKANEPLKPLGRPRYSPSERFRMLLAARRELKRQGWDTGAETVAKSIFLSKLRLIRECVKALRSRHNAKLEKKRQENRISVYVLAKRALLCQDATQLVKRCQAEVVKDRATLKTVRLRVGGHTKAGTILSLLKGMKQSGDLPLVWATDNGSIYREKEVKKYLRNQRVIALLSKVHTPQDNGAMERGIGELKATAEFDLCPPANAKEAAERIHEARFTLDHGRRRRSKGYKTADELEQSTPNWYHLVDRKKFYSTARATIKLAVRGVPSARNRRRAEREAIFRTLEQFHLIARTRGGGLSYPLVPESIL